MSVCPARIVLGTMRMQEKGQSTGDWMGWLSVAWDLGIRRLHSSDEYDSFPFLCDLLSRLREERPEIAFGHVVKLAEPSFDDAAFDGARMRARVLSYLASLGTNQLAAVQWMWRKNVNDDEPRRLREFAVQTRRIGTAALDLKSEGVIREFACFPYTTGFADAALAAGIFDGLILYLNRMERDFVGAVERASRAGMAVDVIRPFAAGKAFRAGETGADLLAELFDRDPVRHAVLSVSSADQMVQLLPPSAPAAGNFLNVEPTSP